jgi:hypothetical protein
MTVAAFTWQRYGATLPATERTWRKLERITMKAEAEAPHPYAGMSVLDILWQDLDEIMDKLMAEGAPELGTLTRELRDGVGGAEASEIADEWYTTLKEWGELRGQAQGLAFAIAIATNPYAGDVPAVKVEASARWAKRQKR